MITSSHVAYEELMWFVSGLAKRSGDNPVHEPRGVVHEYSHIAGSHSVSGCVDW